MAYYTRSRKNCRTSGYTAPWITSTSTPVGSDKLNLGINFFKPVLVLVPVLVPIKPKVLGAPLMSYRLLSRPCTSPWRQYPGCIWRQIHQFWSCWRKITDPLLRLLTFQNVGNLLISSFNVTCVCPFNRHRSFPQATHFEPKSLIKTYWLGIHSLV